MGPSQLLTFAGRTNENEWCKKTKKQNKQYFAGRANEFLMLSLGITSYQKSFEFEKPLKSIGFASSWQALGFF